MLADPMPANSIPPLPLQPYLVPPRWTVGVVVGRVVGQRVVIGHEQPFLEPRRPAERIHHRPARRAQLQVVARQRLPQRVIAARGQRHPHHQPIAADGHRRAKTPLPRQLLLQLPREERPRIHISRVLTRRADDHPVPIHVEVRPKLAVRRPAQSLERSPVEPFINVGVNLGPSRIRHEQQTQRRIVIRPRPELRRGRIARRIRQRLRPQPLVRELWQHPVGSIRPNRPHIRPHNLIHPEPILDRLVVARHAHHNEAAADRHAPPQHVRHRRTLPRVGSRRPVVQQPARARRSARPRPRRARARTQIRQSIEDVSRPLFGGHQVVIGRPHHHVIPIQRHRRPKMIAIVAFVVRLRLRQPAIRRQPRHPRPHPADQVEHERASLLGVLARPVRRAHHDPRRRHRHRRPKPVQPHRLVVAVGREQLPRSTPTHSRPRVNPGRAHPEVARRRAHHRLVALDGHRRAKLAAPGQPLLLHPRRRPRIDVGGVGPRRPHDDRAPADGHRLAEPRVGRPIVGPDLRFEAPHAVDALEHIHRARVRPQARIEGRAHHQEIAVEGHRAPEALSAGRAVRGIQLGLLDPGRSIPHLDIHHPISRIRQGNLGPHRQRRPTHGHRRAVFLRLNRVRDLQLVRLPPRDDAVQRQHMQGQIAQVQVLDRNRSDVEVGVLVGRDDPEVRQAMRHQRLHARELEPVPPHRDQARTRQRRARMILAPGRGPIARHPQLVALAIERLRTAVEGERDPPVGRPHQHARRSDQGGAGIPRTRLVLARVEGEADQEPAAGVELPRIARRGNRLPLRRAGRARRVPDGHRVPVPIHQPELPPALVPRLDVIRAQRQRQEPWPDRRLLGRRPQHGPTERPEAGQGRLQVHEH